MDVKKIIPLLQIMKPQELLKKVVAHNISVQGINGAEVRVLLNSGRTISGIPLKSDDNGNVVLVTLDNSISYISTGLLEGIELRNPDTIIDLITDGSYFVLPDKIPTRLQLRRNFDTISKDMSDSFGFELKSTLLDNDSLSEAEKFQIGQFLKVFKETTEIIVKDSEGRKAMEQLNAVRIDSSEKNLELFKDDNNLNIAVNFKNKFSKDFEEHFRSAFEAKL